MRFGGLLLLLLEIPFLYIETPLLAFVDLV